MKNWNAKIWLAAFALQLPPCVAGGVAADELGTTEPSVEGPPAASVPAVVMAATAAPADDAPPAVGTLTVQYTISGRRDPADCGGIGVARFVLSMRSSPADDQQAEGPCDAFQVSIDLAPGSYSGDALLVDRFDRPVTLSVPVEQVDIVAGREALKSIDFPVGAFLYEPAPGAK